MKHRATGTSQTALPSSILVLCQILQRFGSDVGSHIFKLICDVLPRQFRLGMRSETISTLNILSCKASQLHSTAQIQYDTNTVAAAKPQRKATQAHSPQAQLDRTRTAFCPSPANACACAATRAILPHIHTPLAADIEPRGPPAVSQEPYMHACTGFHLQHRR